MLIAEQSIPRNAQCRAIHPKEQARCQSTATREARASPDDLLLVLQLAANESLVLLIDCSVELPRWRGWHIPLRRPQRRLYPVHLRRLAAAEMPSHCSRTVRIAPSAPDPVPADATQAHA